MQSHNLNPKLGFTRTCYIILETRFGWVVVMLSLQSWVWEGYNLISINDLSNMGMVMFLATW
jgi:hypothetical protein